MTSDRLCKVRLRPRLCPIPVAVCQKDARGRPMRIPRPWERWRPGCCIHPGRLPCGPSALFNIGDLTLSLYESELATGLLPNKITDLSSLSNSGEARSPILNRACSVGRSPTICFNIGPVVNIRIVLNGLFLAVPLQPDVGKLYFQIFRIH